MARSGGMNRQLHDMGFQTMISVWPRFTGGSRFYDFLLKKGWFEHLADGTRPMACHTIAPDRTSTPLTRRPRAGSGNDPRQHCKQRLRSFWADETEPDLPPNGSYFYIGPGTRFFNVYPLFHTAALYDGFRRDLKIARVDPFARCLPGSAAQRGHVLVLRYLANVGHAEAADSYGARFTASGMATGATISVDGNTCRPSIIPSTRRCSTPPMPATTWAIMTIIPNYTRAGSSMPRSSRFSARMAAAAITKSGHMANGGTDTGEVPQAAVYTDALHLLPGYRTYQTGAPYMRALFMDFPNDPKVARLTDEYMFGPAFLVAPVTEQGATSRTSTCRRARLVQLLDG